MLDINKIAQEKITAMEECGKVKEHIEKEVEKLVLGSITDALSSLDIRCAIKIKAKESISQAIDALDFTAYNSFIAEKVRQLTTGALRDDVAKKVQDSFESIFVRKRDSIKLSEIFEAYREWLISDLDENEQYELNNEFYAGMENDEKFGWLKCRLSKEEPEKNYFGMVYEGNVDFSFTISRNPANSNIGKILSAYASGENVRDKMKFHGYNDFEVLILNLLYNDTNIEIDIEDESDIERSLGLDI
ncbi:MAG: hypothetical protein ACI4JN_06520 [Ruminococcus sp.]